MKPSDEPHTVVLNGRTDNRKYQEEKVPQYRAVEISELVVENGSCALPMIDLVPRMGSVAGFVDDRLLACGGFSIADDTYMDSCQKQVKMILESAILLHPVFTKVGRNANNEIIPWQSAGSLSQARAFASSVTIEVEFNNTIFYVLGGYEMLAGFLDSVEVYDKNAETFSVKQEMQMPQGKSHFCTLFVEVRESIVDS